MITVGQSTTHSCREEGDISLVKEDEERLPGGSYSRTDLKDEDS